MLRLNLNPKNVTLLLLLFIVILKSLNPLKKFMKHYKEIGHGELKNIDPMRFFHKEKNLHSKFQKIYFVLKQMEVMFNSS